MGLLRAIVDHLGALGNRSYPLGFSKPYFEKIEGYCRKLSLELGHHSQDDFTMVGSVVPENWVLSFAGGGVRQIEPLPAYDVHLERGSVHKYQSTVMDSNGTILMDLSDSLKPSACKWNTSDHLFNIRKDAVRLRRWEGELVVVSSPYCNNYYHWLFDSLPRLESGVCQRASKLYVHQYRSFQRESMEILGISGERIVVADEHQHLRADLLLIPSLPFPPLPAPPSVWRLPVVSRHACGYLREELAARALRFPNEPRRDTSTVKIFIQRSGARGIENENEVWSLLSIEGFQRVALENLSLSEQIRLFGRAETVVGVHGAGLTNIVFCRPGTRVVELMPTAWAMPCYWSISRHVGLDYHRVDVASVAPDGELATAASRVSVDLELFKAALSA